jgi:glycosyltransferase involved in cell wall biosynthesis
MLESIRLNKTPISLAFMSSLQPRNLFDTAFVSAILGAGLLLLSLMPFAPERRLRLLISATRRFDSDSMCAIGKRLLRPWLLPGKSDIWRNRKIGWGRYFGDFADIARDRALSTSLLLKEPGENGEKGVLYCSFEFNWMKLIANHDVRKFLQDYLLVGASSWSPSDHAVLANLCGLSDDPAFIGISNSSDLSQYRMFEPGIYPLPILASDWVDPNDFSPIAHADRSIDIIMVAHFDNWKRHWLLFEALTTMRTDLNVVLIGRNINGRSDRVLKNEAKAMGVPQQLTILRNLEIGEVMRFQCDAKISVTLSKREGSCVAVTESLFADTPVAMMNDAHIGSRAYINQQTGRIVERRGLSHALSAMIEQSETFSARSWAEAHIPAQTTSKKLNTILRQYSEQAGRPWTRDIAPMCWRYVPRYLNPMDQIRLRPGLERLQRQHGIELAEFVSEKQAARKA